MQSRALPLNIWMCFLVFSFFYFLPSGHSATETKAAGTIRCEMDFSMKSWSVLYKSGKGSGSISCDNGQKAKVILRAQGGGLTIGKREVVNGHGNFTAVNHIRELYGDYAAAEVHAGVGKSAEAHALTKGDISLTLTGTGKGIDLGFDFGKFSIIPVPQKKG